MPFFCGSTNRNLNVIFSWKLAELILGGIIVEKVKNPLWGMLSYFYTRVPTPNKQPFIRFLILSPCFCSDLSLLTFSYILFYFFYMDVGIFNGVKK